MAFAIVAWNLNPNRVWFVRLADGGAGISVELYLTQTDAEERTGLQASASSEGFGTSVAVALTIAPGALYCVSFYQQTCSWHLRVSGSAGDASKIFRVKEFVDLEDINHPIFRNSDLIPIRAAAEIDGHTHARIAKEIELGSHVPTLEPGDAIRLHSSRRGKDEISQASEHRMIGEQKEGGEARLTSTIVLNSYLALKR